MDHYDRDYREYLRGYMAGLNMLQSHSTYCLDIAFLTISNESPLDEAVKKGLAAHKWEDNEIPNLNTISKQELLANLNQLFSTTIPRQNAFKIAEHVVSIFDAELGSKYQIFGQSFDTKHNEPLIFVLEIINERIIVVIHYN